MKVEKGVDRRTMGDPCVTLAGERAGGGGEE